MSFCCVFLKEYSTTQTYNIRIFRAELNLTLTLEISKVLSDTVRHVEESYPEECCGLLGARDGRDVGSLRSRNTFTGLNGDGYSTDLLALGREDGTWAIGVGPDFQVYR